MSKPMAIMSLAFEIARRWTSSMVRSFHRNFSSSVSWIINGTSNVSCNHNRHLITSFVTSINSNLRTKYDTTSSQHARPSGVLRRWSDGLERAAWRPPRPVAQCRQFQEEAKDASVSECTWTLSALEALHNALYKFKTYLLTYLLCCKFNSWPLCFRVHPWGSCSHKHTCLCHQAV